MHDTGTYYGQIGRYYGYACMILEQHGQNMQADSIGTHKRHTYHRHMLDIHVYPMRIIIIVTRGSPNAYDVVHPVR